MTAAAADHEADIGRKRDIKNKCQWNKAAFVTSPLMDVLMGREHVHKQARI